MFTGSAGSRIRSCMCCVQQVVAPLIWATKIFMKTHSCRSLVSWHKNKISNVKASYFVAHLSLTAQCYYRIFRLSIYRIFTSSRQCMSILIRCLCELNAPPKKNYSQNRSKLIPGKLISSFFCNFQGFVLQLFLVSKLVKKDKYTSSHPNLSCMYTIQ